MGRINISTSPVSLSEVERKHPELFLGGHFIPTKCVARYRVAIIIPYRERKSHLAIWLKHMHPFLQKQQLDYTIFVVEQAGEKIKTRAFR